jgi:hypothetical protein
MSAQLARALLRRTVRLFAAVPPEARGPSLAALDGFLAAPGPASYLQAVRVLGDAARAVRAAEAGEAFAERAHAHGLERVRALDWLEPATVEALDALPIDARAGQRLRALATLLEAHQQLAGRVRQADTLRGLPPPPTRAAPRRSTTRRARRLR